MKKIWRTINVTNLLVRLAIFFVAYTSLCLFLKFAKSADPFLFTIIYMVGCYGLVVFSVFSPELVRKVRRLRKRVKKKAEKMRKKKRVIKIKLPF